MEYHDHCQKRGRRDDSLGREQKLLRAGLRGSIFSERVGATALAPTPLTASAMLSASSAQDNARRHVGINDPLLLQYIKDQEILRGDRNPVLPSTTGMPSYWASLQRTEAALMGRAPILASSSIPHVSSSWVSQASNARPFESPLESAFGLQQRQRFRGAQLSTLYTSPDRAGSRRRILDIMVNRLNHVPRPASGLHLGAADQAGSTSSVLSLHSPFFSQASNARLPQLDVPGRISAPGAGGSLQLLHSALLLRRDRAGLVSGHTVGAAIAQSLFDPLGNELDASPMRSSAGQLARAESMNKKRDVASAEGLADHLSRGRDSALTGREAILLYVPCDDDGLSPYQCLARKQIEIFEAQEEETESNARGRNKAVVLGQLGIRCKWCKVLHQHRQERAAISFPSRLDRIYQAGQAMASEHFGIHCKLIPAEIREELVRLRGIRSSALGGKQYWADAAQGLGIYEDKDGLRFEKV